MLLFCLWFLLLQIMLPQICLKIVFFLNYALIIDPLKKSFRVENHVHFYTRNIVKLLCKALYQYKVTHRFKKKKTLKLCSIFCAYKRTYVLVVSLGMSYVNENNFNSVYVNLHQAVVTYGLLAQHKNIPPGVAGHITALKRN